MPFEIFHTTDNLADESLYINVAFGPGSVPSNVISVGARLAALGSDVINFRSSWINELGEPIAGDGAFVLQVVAVDQLPREDNSQDLIGSPGESVTLTCREPFQLPAVKQGRWGVRITSMVPNSGTSPAVGATRLRVWVEIP